MLILLTIILGLLIGSFLNVVIARLPHSTPIFNIAVPRSQCPHCHTPIRAIDNIPLISYLLLRGRCRHCQQKISWRYPLIELLTAIITVVVVLQFGLSWQTLFTLIFCWALIALFFIDIDTQLLPDEITLPLLWLGLIINSFNMFIDLQSAVIGAVVGYLSLWLVTWIYALITKRVGMGHGDFKLLAAIGAWVGWELLPCVILFSALLGLICGVMILFIRKQSRHTPIAFGPYLAIGGGSALLWGNLCLSLV